VRGLHGGMNAPDTAWRRYRPGMGRTDRAELFIAAPREQIYAAMVDPAALEVWLAPDNMRGRVLSFDARPGGGFRMELTYLDSSQGKSSAHSDITDVTFVELLPGERVVQQVVFDAEDPVFAGTMTMTWSLFESPNGTVVEIRADDVPPGISSSDHAAGLAASLDNLSAYVAATPGRPGPIRRGPD
jgi:uncharacterized protein YndB with AHSA1/START domain